MAITYSEMAGWSDWICNFTVGLDGEAGEIPIDRVGDVVHVEFPRPDAQTLGLISGL